MNEQLKIIQEMRSAASRAINASEPRVFFPLLHEFVEYLHHVTLKDALKSIAKKFQTDVKQLAALESKALDELKSRAQQIKNYLKTNCSNSQTLILVDLFNEKVQLRNPLDPSMKTPLEHILFQLLNDDSQDHSPFLSTMGNIQQINAYKFINDEEIFPCFYEWQNEHIYFTTQIRAKSAWFSLNQLIVFFERYDLRFYQKLIAELKKKGIEITRLQSEHIELLKYAFFDVAPPANLFPSIEEYKIHIQRTLDSLSSGTSKDISQTLKMPYSCSYDSFTGQLKIDSQLVLKFKINKNPALILKLLFSKKQKALACLEAYNGLWLSSYDSKKTLTSEDLKDLRDIIRQINERLKIQKFPEMFLIQESKIKTDQYEILITTSYTKN